MIYGYIVCTLLVVLLVFYFLPLQQNYENKKVSFHGSRPIKELRHHFLDTRVPITGSAPAPHHPHRPHHRRYFPEFWPNEFVYGSDYVSKFNQNGIDPIYTVDRSCEQICYLNRERCYASPNPLKERCPLDYHNCMYDCFAN